LQSLIVVAEAGLPMFPASGSMVVCHQLLGHESLRQNITHSAEPEDVKLNIKVTWSASVPEEYS
jgi:hypothetical protein